MINKNKIIPGIKYSGLKISLKFFEYNEMKNIDPNGITKPGIPFAITARPEKI